MDDNERIITELVNTRKWSESAARLGARAGFKCEYCDRDLLRSVDDYKEWQEDHIVPLSSNGARHDESNLAIACRTCNVNVKRKWDPRTVCDAGASREELVQVRKDGVRLELSTRACWQAHLSTIIPRGYERLHSLTAS